MRIPTMTMIALAALLGGCGEQASGAGAERVRNGEVAGGDLAGHTHDVVERLDDVADELEGEEGDEEVEEGEDGEGLADLGLEVFHA